MVGREVILTVQKKPAQPGEEVLKVTDLHVKDVRGLEVCARRLVRCARR